MTGELDILEGMVKVINRKTTKGFRLALRKNQTIAEKKLWSRLRNKNFQGIKFFRQSGIGNYIADFYCPDHQLVIEIDGSQHHEEGIKQYDKLRTEYFESLSINVVRFSNSDVLLNMDEVLERIYVQISRPDDIMKVEDD